VCQPNVRDLSVVEKKCFQARQPLQVGQPSVRDLSATEIKRLQPCQPLQVRQAGVCDLSAPEIKPYQPRQLLQVRQPRVRDLSVAETKRFQCRHPLQVGHAGVRDLSALEIKCFERRQPLQVRHPRVGDLRTTENKLFQRRQALQVHKPCVRDLSRAKSKHLQPRQPSQVGQAGVGDPSAIEHKIFKPGQPLQVRHASVRDVSGTEMKQLQPLQPLHVGQVSVGDLAVVEMNLSHVINVVPRQPASQERLGECLTRLWVGFPESEVVDESLDRFNGNHGAALSLGGNDDLAQCHAEHGHHGQQRGQAELRPAAFGSEQGDELGKGLGHARQHDAPAGGGQERLERADFDDTARAANPGTSRDSAGTNDTGRVNIVGGGRCRPAQGDQSTTEVTMHRFRFSLLAMFGFVAVVAVACAALARPSQLWLVVVSASSLGSLFYAVLAAAYGRNARRAFWLGFAVVGWGYVALEWKEASSIAPTEFITNRLQAVVEGTTASSPPPIAYGNWSTSTPVVTAPPGPNDAYAAEPVPVESDAESIIVPSDPAVGAGPTTNDGSIVPSSGLFGYSTTSSYVVYTQSLTDLDMTAFGQIATWLWSILLGSAGGLVALRLYHRRGRQDGQRVATG